MMTDTQSKKTAFEAEQAKLEKLAQDKEHVSIVDGAIMNELLSCSTIDAAKSLLMRIKEGKVANLKIEY